MIFTNTDLRNITLALCRFVDEIKAGLPDCDWYEV